MERVIYINDTASNKTVKLTTNATTFGEVKQAASQAGINTSGKEWLEGITKTIMTTDDTQLPHDVSYQGKITNDLVFVLTNTNKQIKSGAMSYAEMKAYIKNNNLVDAFTTRYGKSYTQGSSAQFTEFINSMAKTKTPSAPKKEEPKAQAPKAVTTSKNECECDCCQQMIKAFATALFAAGPDIMDRVQDELKKLMDASPKSLNLSDEDIRQFKA